MALTINVNGAQRVVHADAETPLLYVLRNDLQLKGARFGCGLGQCGACTVIVDGKAVQSCDVPVSSVVGKAVTTSAISMPSRSVTRSEKSMATTLQVISCRISLCRGAGLGKSNLAGKSWDLWPILGRFAKAEGWAILWAVRSTAGLPGSEFVGWP